MRLSRAASALLATCILSLGCNGDSGSGNTGPTPTTTTTTAGPTAAVVVMDILNYGALTSDGSGSIFQVEIRLMETAGLGANINYIRLDYLRATGELEERSEIGADDIANVLGTNRLDASSTWQQTVGFFFRGSIKRGRELIVTVNLTDDRGNNIDRTARFVFN